MRKLFFLIFLLPFTLFAQDGDDDRDDNENDLRDKLMGEERFGEPGFYFPDDVYGDPNQDPDSMQEYWEMQRSQRRRRN